MFDEIDWSEVGDHDPGQRAERKGSGETNVPVEWATVIVAPKDCPPAGRWWGATAWKAKPSERRQYEEGA